ncbi:alpha-2,8-sialyltransferase 8F-like [Synchiropus splendidus]|uniref:alpha-2,8-sialyltransferase 8F-like n=1 Tax=Synchiropus splendidus TaxID=270530 RepID=UPI00237E7C17|nr:alpha-2,8-sialyltransferase 8F-like [Synchiropus splendidus]
MLKVQSEMRRFNVGIILLLCAGTLLTTIFLQLEQESFHTLPQNHIKSLCDDCKGIIETVVKRHSKTWKKQEENNQKFRQQLRSQCNGIDEAIISRANTPLGSVISGPSVPREYLVKSAAYQLFPDVSPLSNSSYNTCAVVGNGGILQNSSCGKMIDSSDFVVRCNLPPLFGGWAEHVGVKSDLVTANPTIFEKVYGTKPEHQRLLLEKVYPFKDAMILIPAFSYQTNLVLRAVQTLKHFKSPTRPVFFNPKYMDKLKRFWSSRGVAASRLSSGLMMVSMALEVCKHVHVYGFWPFSKHPFGQHYLPHHYYDDVPPKAHFHKMPVEFERLLELHLQGVIQLHLGNCGT